VLSAYDDAGLSTGPLANGSTTDDTSPLVRGSISSALATGESLIVSRDGVRIGRANVSNGEWSFADANVTAGKHSYVARVEDAAGNLGLQSDPFVLTVEVLRTVNGTTGSDTLLGSTGTDRISGVPEAGTKIGKGTVDVLTGNGGSDLFILGDSRGRFYDDGRTSSAGSGDYARITDFGPGDRIQLKGSAAEYFQAPHSVNGFSGTGIFHDSNANGAFDIRDELIALIQNHAQLDATSFIFV
jgi:Ca2+-binding RTX toxin-like protein